VRRVSRWRIAAIAASAGLALTLVLRFTDCGSIGLSGATITVRHSAGWTLALPREIEKRDVVVDRTPAGFSIDPDRGAVARYRREAFIALRPRGDPPPSAWYDVRWVRGAWVHYAVSREENGNGDLVFTLTAWRRCGAGYFLFGEIDHSALFTPDFEHAWAMIRGLSTDGRCADR
jgi:hypothetical protein